MRSCLGGRIMRYTLSVRLSVCPLAIVNSKMENRTTFKLRREVTDVRINWQSNLREGDIS